MPEALYWVCPNCDKALAVDSLRCRFCGQSFHGKDAVKPLRRGLTVETHPGPGVGVTFKLPVDDE
jgi:hypothetical protein